LSDIFLARKEGDGCLRRDCCFLDGKPSKSIRSRTPSVSQYPDLANVFEAETFLNEQVDLAFPLKV